MLLDKKVVVLTGGAQGIGLDCARAYASHGALVTILDKNAEMLNLAREEFGANHLAIACDVSSGPEVANAIEDTLRHFGRIDAIHNNAGIAHPSKTLHDTTEQEFETLFNVNVKSLYLTTKYGLNALKTTKGCILNTSSMVGDIGQELHAVYTATKGAINALTKSMAIDYSPFGIRVNAVAPAGVSTPMVKQWIKEQPFPGQMENYLRHIHPLGYCPEGKEIADACVFLLSDLARFITGTILPVSGGAELGYRKVLMHD
jgi:meso-butanediol dehydrogenase / (S,S)-butanediol dehydrogenase / diacetyl reductase